MAVIDLNALVGGKTWYKSMTVWGLATYTIGETLVAAVCGEGGFLPDSVCEPFSAIVKGLGVVLTVLGIRRKLGG